MDKEIKERIDDINSGIIPEGYKKTKVGIVPWGWEVIKAKEVFSNISNKKHNGDLEVLSSTQDKGIIPRSMLDIDIKYDKESTSNYKKVEKGNFVISLRSFQGGIEYSEYEGLISPAYTVLGSKVEICDDYYKSYLKSPDYIQRLNTAVYGIRDGKNISYDDFSLIYIPFPPLPEQQKIAEILSTQDKLIELQEKKIEQLKELKKAYLQKMFPQKGSKYPELRFKGFTDPWEQCKLGKLIENGIIIEQSDGNHGELYPRAEEFTEKGIPYISASSISADGESIDFNLTKYLPIERAKQFRKGVAKNGDILLAHNATVGPAVLLSMNYEFAILSTSLTLYRLDDKKMNSYYFLQAIRSRFFQIQLETFMAQTTRNQVPILTQRNLLICYPTNINEQEKIGEFLLSFDKHLALHQYKLEQEKQKKKALMQLLLTGIVRTK